GRLADRPAAPGRRRLRRGHRPRLVARDSTRRDPLPSTAPAPPDAAGDGLATRVVVTHPARAHRRGTSRRCPRLPPGETGSAQALVTTVNLRDGAKTSHTPSWPAGNDTASPGRISTRSPLSSVIAMWPSSRTKHSSSTKCHRNRDGSAVKKATALRGARTPTVRSTLLPP